MRLSGILLKVSRSKPMLLLPVAFLAIWFCISLPELKLHLHSLRSASFSREDGGKVLDPNLALFKEIEKAGNIPWSYSKLHKKNGEFKGNAEVEMKAVNCTQRPLLWDIKFNNKYWQMVMTKDGVNSTDISAYGAYLDTREEPSIRILINSHDYLEKEMRKPTFCQLWFPGIDHPLLSQVTKVEYIYRARFGHNHPFLVTCKLPGEILPLHFQVNEKLEVFPESVSLVQEKCERASNNLKINYQVPSKKKDFGVCVRWLNFPTKDLSLRLIEWIEMMGILGAEGIHFHLFAVHPNVLKVLKYYEGIGRVTLKESSLPGYQPNFPQMRHDYTFYWPNGTWSYNYSEPMVRQEVVPYNDCFYTYMYTYKYIAALDIDEVILPANSQNWKDLLSELKSPPLETPCFTMVVFSENMMKPHTSELPTVKVSAEKSVQRNIDGYPPYMMTQVYSPGACNTFHKFHAKCLFNTKAALLIYNHGPLGCLPNKATPCLNIIDKNVAYVHHHKKVCTAEKKNKTITDKFDTSIRRFKDELTLRRDGEISKMDFLQ